MKHNDEIRWSDLEPICILRMVLKNIWMVAASGLLAAMIAILAVQWLWTPQYTSSMTYAVMSKTGGSTIGGYSTSVTLASKFSNMMESRLMKEMIIQEVGREAASGTVKAAAVSDTNLLQVSCTASSPRVAYEMVRALDEHYSDLGVYVDSNASLRILTGAQVPTNPSNAVSPKRTAVMAALAAAIAMSAALCWYSIRRDTIMTRSAARNKLDTDVLVEISHERAARRRNSEQLLLTNPATSFYFQEAFYRIRTAVEQSLDTIQSSLPEGGRVILVSSAAASEGKSTVAANLALAFAQKYDKVLLIDADLRNPTQTNILGVRPEKTAELSTLLRAGELTEENVSAALHYDETTNLISLLNRKPVRNAGELLASQTFADLVELSRANMDIVIIDTPPAGIFSDSSVLSDLADAAVLVVHQDRASAAEINDVVDMFTQSSVKLCGCVLNDMRTGRLIRHSYSSGYGYGYGYGYSSYSKKTQGYGRHRSRKEEN